MEETRVCTKCGEEKPLSDFRFLNTQGRYQTRCRTCECEYTKSRYNPSSVNREEMLAKRRRAYAVNAIASYISVYGEDILDEAKEKNKSQHR